MFQHSKRTVTMLCAAMAVALSWGALSVSAPPPGKGGGGDNVPGGPGLIAFNDFNAGGLILLVNPDGSTALGVQTDRTLGRRDDCQGASGVRSDRPSVYRRHGPRRPRTGRVV